MAKSIKSVLKGIKFVDVAVVVVFVAVMICLMKKMDVIEGLCVPSQRGIDLFNRINDEVGAQPGIDIPTECRDAEARRGACEYLMLPQYYTDPTRSGNQPIPPFNMCEEAPDRGTPGTADGTPDRGTPDRERCVPSQRGIDLFNRINDEVGALPGIDIPTECREAEARRGACEYLMLPQYYTDPTRNGNQRIPPFNMCEEAPSLPPSMTQCQEARDTLRDCP